MKKYMIRFECSAGNLSVEKFLHTYIRENWDRVIVSEDNISKVVNSIVAQVEQYLMLHLTAKTVNVSSCKNYCTGGYYITVGSMNVVLVPVKRELV